MFVHLRELIICPKINGKRCQAEIRYRHAKIANSSHPSPEASSNFLVALAIEEMVGEGEKGI